MASASDVAIQAAIDGNLGHLKMMASKANLREAKDHKGRNALHLAAEKGHLEVCRFLMEESGLDVDSAEGHCEAVRLLLSKGVDVDAINSLGTPLHMAASKGKDQVLNILLEHGADPHKVVRQLFTPLLVACLGRSLKCMKLLVEAGADVNFISPRGPIVFMEAVNYGLTDIVKFLLEAGADPTIPDEGALLEKELLADPKSRGNEAFAKRDYAISLYLYGLAADKDPLDAKLYANLSICWLQLGDGEEALSDARKCKMMRPGSSKAWYREGAALSFLKNYKGSVDAFTQALKLDPSNDEIKKALREAMEAMRTAACSG